MFLRKTFLPLALLVILFLPTSTVFAAAVTAEITAAAVKEGNLYIYGAIAPKVAAALVKEFNSLYPGVKVDYIDMDSAEVFNHYQRDLGARKVSADILWSGEISLQAALVRDGFSLKYHPTESSNIAALANLGDVAYVTGFEPVVMAYNKKLLAEKELPKTRSALVKALADKRWQEKLGTVDPEKSGRAFLLLTQDLAYGQNFWGLVRKFGDAGLKLYPDYRTLLERIGSGEVLAGYNLPLAVVLQVVGTDANIGWIYMVDYTLLIPQTTFITKVATHPNAAMLWIEFIRSAQAQQLIAAGCNLFPVRNDLVGGEMKKQGGVLPSAQVLKVISTGDEVARFNQAGLKRGFLLKWKQLLKLVQ